MRDGSTSTLMNDCVPAPIVRRSPANESNKNSTSTFLISDFIVRRLPKLLALAFERARRVTMTSSWTCSRSFMHVCGVKKTAGWTGVTLHNSWIGPVLRASIGRTKYSPSVIIRSCSCRALTLAARLFFKTHAAFNSYKNQKVFSNRFYQNSNLKLESLVTHGDIHAPSLSLRVMRVITQNPTHTCGFSYKSFLDCLTFCE